MNQNLIPDMIKTLAEQAKSASTSSERAFARSRVEAIQQYLGKVVDGYKAADNFRYALRSSKK